MAAVDAAAADGAQRGQPRGRGAHGTSSRIKVIEAVRDSPPERAVTGVIFGQLHSCFNSASRRIVAQRFRAVIGRGGDCLHSVLAYRAHFMILVWIGTM